MRRAIVIFLIVVSLMRLDRERSKRILRRAAALLCRLTLNRISRPYELGAQTTIVFAPHQDDETLACGGLIARKRNDGLPVHVVFITDGSASHPNHPQLSPRDVSVLRHREAREALAILGVESIAIHFLDEPDGTLHQLDAERRGALVARMSKLLGELQPGEIFLPCNPDGSSEHDSAFGFVMDALQRTGLRPDIWQYPVWSWWNPLLLLRHMMFTRDRRRAPVEDYELIKRRAMACYRSQIEPLPPLVEPSLPRELLQILDGETEYFFRFHLPVAEKTAEARPAVI